MITGILFFHGFESSPNSGIGRAIADEFDGKEEGEVRYFVNNFKYDYLDFRTTKRDVDATIYYAKEDAQQYLVVGSSAGGFWARYAQERLKCPALLINPSLYAHNAFLKYGLKSLDRALYQQLHLDFLIYQQNTRLPTQVILGAKDEVVDPQKTMDNFCNFTLLPNEGHRIKDKEIVINKIKQLLGHSDENIQALPGRKVY